MLKWLKQLDRVLRGDATRTTNLQDGQFTLPVLGLSIILILLSVFYGACIGSFNLLHPLDAKAVITVHDAWMQTFASAVKMPLLFVLTLCVTFPSLYVFNALSGSRLTLLSVLRVLVACLGVLVAVVASLGPIVLFFSLCTTSYPFMQLLNVVCCGISGLLGLTFLLRTLNRIILAQIEIEVKETRPVPPPPVVIPSTVPGGPPIVLPGPLDRLSPTHHKARAVFNIWTIVFALVGAQMSWVLRPFIGSPNMPFEWIRHRESNFFLAVLRALEVLFN
jgi:hypothetical protein